MLWDMTDLAIEQSMSHSMTHLAGCQGRHGDRAGKGCLAQFTHKLGKLRVCAAAEYDLHVTQHQALCDTSSCSYVRNRSCIDASLQHKECF